MPKQITWTDPAKAQLRAIDQATALRILHAITRYLRRRRRREVDAQVFDGAADYDTVQKFDWQGLKPSVICCGVRHD